MSAIMIRVPLRFSGNRTPEWHAGDNYDWWKIGGCFRGRLTGYNPLEDPANLEHRLQVSERRMRAKIRNRAAADEQHRLEWGVMVVQLTPDRVLDLVSLLLMTPGLMAAVFGDRIVDNIQNTLSRLRAAVVPDKLSDAFVEEMIFKDQARRILSVVLRSSAALCAAYEGIEIGRALYFSSQRPTVMLGGLAGVIVRVAAVRSPLLHVLGIVVLVAIPLYVWTVGELVWVRRRSQWPKDELDDMMLGRMFAVVDAIGNRLGRAGLLFKILVFPLLLIPILTFPVATVSVAFAGLGVVIVVWSGAWAGSLLLHANWRRVAFVAGLMVAILDHVVTFR